MEEEKVFSEFYDICGAVQAAFDKEWRGAEEWEKEEKLRYEKNAIIGYKEATDYYKEKIKDFIIALKLERKIVYPDWYKSLEDGIFAELYGLAGLTPWAYDETEEYRNSSSAKLIGERLYCLIDGKSVLQPQRISSGR